MNEHSIQSEGVFEITDYTTASDWERFIAGIEETLTEWKLNKQTDTNKIYKELPAGSISSGIWHEKYDTIKFGNVVFDIKYQYFGGASEAEPTSDGIDKDDQSAENPPDCVGDLISTSNDFASKAHCLVRWYNLRKFIILVPRADTIVAEDKVKLLLSSASVALANVDCHVPIFVQIHNPKNNFYQGISEHASLRTMYEMIFFKKNIKQYSYLSDLITLFREKANCDLNDPISSTIRLNYCLDMFDLFLDPSEEFSGNEHIDDEEQDELVKMTRDPVRKQMQDMRSGGTFEQVTDAMKECLPHPYRILRFIHVAALWPPVSDKVITDSQVHSDLDAAEAPVWTMRCVTKDNCNMKQVHETQAVYDLLCAAINYSYDKLDGSLVFSDTDRETLKSKCLKLSYDLASKPEVMLSDRPSDEMRKLVALLFYRAAELNPEEDALDQIAGQLKRKPSLNEVYRNFSKKIKPSVKEFIIRAQVPRPFNSNSCPNLAQRMFCTICDEEFRLCGAFTELCK